jgi:hypothetical protein
MYTLIFACVLLVAWIMRRRSLSPALPQDLPVLNTKPEEWFTRLRSRMRNTLNYRDAVHQAYQMVWATQLSLLCCVS